MPFNQEAFIENVKFYTDKSDEYFAEPYKNYHKRSILKEEMVSLQQNLKRMIGQYEEEQP